MVLHRGLLTPVGSHLDLLFEQGCVPWAPATKTTCCSLQAPHYILPCLCTCFHLGLEYLLPRVSVCSALNTPLKRSLLGGSSCGPPFRQWLSASVFLTPALPSISPLKSSAWYFIMVCLIHSCFSTVFKSSLMAGTVIFCIPVPCLKSDLLQKHVVNA